jgi:hypothetical protein
VAAVAAVIPIPGMGVDITGLSVTITPPIVLPTLVDDPAKINFTARKSIAGNAYPVQVDQCLVSYTYTGIAPAPAVPIPNLTIPNPCSITADGVGTCNMTLITRTMKEDFWNNGIDRGWSKPGTYPAPYTANFNCDFSNLNANNGAFGTNTGFTLELALGEMTVLPATANTGTNTGSSTFTITWGMPPFGVPTTPSTFVDVSAVVQADNSFTVTGNGTGDGDATITVTDSLGQIKTVVVTVPAP